MFWKSAILGVNLKLVGCGQHDSAEPEMYFTYADTPAAVGMGDVK